MSASIEEVVGDYYKKILDYLDKNNNDNNGNLNFSKIDDNEKASIIINLYEFATGVDELIGNEKKYWDNKKKESTIFLIFYILALVFIFFIMMIFLIMKIQYDKKEGNNILLTLILYVIIYEVILSIIILFIKNIVNIIQLSNQQKKLLDNDLNNYLNIIIKDKGTKLFFVQLGYYRKEFINKKEFKDKLKDTFIYLPNENYGLNIDTLIDLNNIELYNKFKTGIETLLIQFYDNGNGYISVNKIIIRSNPILLFKESDNLIKYYKDLIVNKNVDNKIDNKDIVKKIIVIKIIEYLNNFFYNNDTVKQTNKFNSIYELLCIYIYNIYLFLYKKGTINIINFENVNNIYTDSDIENIKLQINLLFDKNNSNVINIISTIDLYSNYNEYIKNPDIIKKINLFIPVMNQLYNYIIDEFEGSDIKKYNLGYFSNSIVLKYANSDDNIDILNAIIGNIYNKCLNFEKIDIIKTKRERLINLSVSDSILYNIDILNYQSYIVETILSIDIKYSDYIDEVNDIIKKISYDVTNKTRFIKNNDENKYVTIPDFISNLDNMSYDELTNNLQINYFYDIVNGFYLDTNDAVLTKKKNFKNIYFEKQNSLDLWNTAINMSISIIVFVLIYLMIVNYNEKIFKQTTEDCNNRNEAIYRDNKLNKWIKIIAPIFLGFFIIAIIIAWKRKLNSVFEYNKMIIQKNTKELTYSLKSIQDVFYSINKKITSPTDNNIGSITEITKSDKVKIYEELKIVIRSYDNCNYIIESSGVDIPFPYAEVISYGFTLLIILIVFFYIYTTIDPLKRLIEIKDMNKMKSLLYVTEDIEGFTNELNILNTCHQMDMDIILFSIKIAFVSFIILFLIIYSVTIITSSSDFKKGLFNSVYYEKRKCYNKT